MPKTKMKNTDGIAFGKRLATLRKEAGYSQQELANELNVTKRMIAYYEGETEHPPTTLLVPLAKALGVTTDELLGANTIKRKTPRTDARLWRRFKQSEKLPNKERRYLMHVIDTFLENAKIKNETASK